jgi:NAD(P)-dependent dehydrogenase (short-subunit alcohol dehydrogenase family)
VTEAPGTVLVIGAQGVLGGFAARAFADEGWYVRRGGRRPEEAIDFRLVDLDREETLREACAGADLVVNAVAHPGLAAERVVLKEGGTLLSIGGLPLAATDELCGRPGTPAGLVVLNAGLVPGATTLAFKALLALHPDADELEYAWASVATQSAGRAGNEFALSQLTGRGRLQVKTLAFPGPVGRRRCIEFGRGEEGWFGCFAHDHRCRTWMYMGPAPVMAAILALNRLGALGLARRLPSGSGSPSRRPTTEPKRDVMTVLREGRRLGAYTMEAAGDYAATVAATLGFAGAVLALRAAKPGLLGAHSAETLFDLAELTPGFERRGLRLIPE